jgi:hypothetical protein
MFLNKNKTTYLKEYFINKYTDFFNCSFFDEILHRGSWESGLLIRRREKSKY